MAAISPQAAVRELWRRGEVESLLFHPGQKKINQLYEALPGGLIVLNISRQWGKTYFLVLKAITTALKQPGSRIRIGAALETDLTEFIEPAFEAALQTCPERLKPKYNQQKKRYVFPNGKNPARPYVGGSIIKCVGLDKKPNGLRGNTIDLILLDEAGFIARLNYLYEHVIVPLTTHRPKARVVLLSTPPESPDHEFWEFVDRAKLAGAYAEFTIDENPMLSPADVERLATKLNGRHTTAFKREYLCQRIVDSEKALTPECTPEWVKENVLDFDPVSDSLYQFWHKYEWMDIGVQNDKTLNLYAYYKFDESCVYVLDESDISGSVTTTDLIESRIREKEKLWEWDLKYQVYRRTADNSHPLLLNDLNKRDLVFSATNKEKLHEMLGKVRVWLKAGRIKVHPRCKQLIGCLTSGVWDKHRAKFAQSKVFGHYDALAALIYGIRNIDEYTNPIPEYVYNPGGWPLAKKKENLSPLGQGMKGIFQTLK